MERPRQVQDRDRKWLKGARWALLKAPERLTARQAAKLAEVQHANRSLYRAYLLKEELRALYHLPDPALADEHLAAWLAWASRSKLKPFLKLARTIRRYREGILAAIRLGLSNARLEGQPLLPLDAASQEWAERSNAELIPTPTYASYLNRIECHFWAIQEFVVKNADYESWEELQLAMGRHIGYRNGSHRDRRLVELERRKQVA